MAVTPIFPVLLLTVITRCRSDHPNGFSNSASQFGTLLKPPPPPPQLASLLPVPFHLGPGRTQTHNSNFGYQHQAAPPLPTDFKFPAPFYKQYNFNFVPPPQPFTTTPSPSMFQKVSGWLFPPQQTTYGESAVYNNNVAPVKKDCNPCNLVPWLPVIRYNVGAKNIHPNPVSTYGPPNPTAYADSLKSIQKYPQPFSAHNQDRKPLQLSPGILHANYGPPTQNYNSGVSGPGSSTYGPPSATHTPDILSPNPPSSTFSQPSSFHNNAFNSQFLSTPSQEIPNSFYNTPSSTYRAPSSSYETPSPVYGTPQFLTTTYQSVTPQYDPGTLNKELPQQGEVELLENVSTVAEQQVPNHNTPTAFKNSYGEPITNTHLFDISYPISATAAESSKVKTQVLPNETKVPTTNMSFALSNPAPFTLNRGRNIHTLQPIAFPNLSVSPLPPIFNARPFRPATLQFTPNILHGINQMQQSNSNVHIQQSIPISEYTHSVEYPATIIQSPVIEISAPTISNHTKGYRNIPNSYVVDEYRDISSQASESVSATKSISDVSFESTGAEFGNDLYDSGVPLDLHQPSRFPSNHRPNFADLRGVNDEDIDKYRTENNLQNIDSPLLYLKPSAPHKNHGNFIIAVSSPIPENEYEIYDDIPTTAAPLTPTLTSSWDESRKYYQEDLRSTKQENKYKPKLVQIIVPYTTGNEGQESNNDYVQMAHDWPSTPNDEYQARKVPSNTNNHINTVTETYSTEPTTTTEESLQIPTDVTNSEQYNPTDSPKDLNDVKEPPFDIIKLQHTIDDWTEQEYSKQYRAPQRTRNSENYAKKIPDDYFTTTVPANYVTTANNYYNDFYDHEGSSSILYSVTDDVNNKTIKIPQKEYNTIERPKATHTSVKNKQPKEVAKKLHIYTAASSFRTTSSTTTPVPWGKIQTSISPFTKEKVYVVTSKPWRESRNITDEWYELEPFPSNKTISKTKSSASSNFPFRSPRFMNRPSFGFTSGGKIESDQSYEFSKSWFQSINRLETQDNNNSTSLYEATHNTTESYN